MLWDTILFTSNRLLINSQDNEMRYIVYYHLIKCNLILSTHIVNHNNKSRANKQINTVCIRLYFTFLGDSISENHYVSRFSSYLYEDAGVCSTRPIISFISNRFILVSFGISWFSSLRRMINNNSELSPF